MPEQFLAPGHSIQRPRILSQKLLSSGAQEQRVLEASDFLSRQPVVRESSPLSSTHNRWILVVNRIHRASEVAEIGNSRNTDECMPKLTAASTLARRCTALRSTSLFV